MHDDKQEEELTNTDMRDVHVVRDAQAVKAEIENEKTLERKPVISMRTISDTRNGQVTHLYVLPPEEAYSLICDLAEVLFNEEGNAEFRRIFEVGDE